MGLIILSLLHMIQKHTCKNGPIEMMKFFAILKKLTKGPKK